MLHFITIFVVLVLVNSQNIEYRYETSGRVTDRIASFTSHIESVVLQSLIEFEMNKGVVNKTTQVSDNMASVVKVNPQMVRFFICLENGLFQGLINEYYHLNNQTLSDICLTPRYPKQNTLQIPTWSGPYVTTSYTESYSVLSYGVPLYNIVNGSNIYLGLIAADISYGFLSEFLSTTYNNSDKNVFIVDKKTGALMGSSIPAQLSHIPAESYHHSNVRTSYHHLFWNFINSIRFILQFIIFIIFHYLSLFDCFHYLYLIIFQEIIFAIQSENALIYGATQFLMSHEWPEHLLIYGKYYLESVLYENQGNSIFFFLFI
jgi:hypothetical protein